MPIHFFTCSPTTAYEIIISLPFQSWQFPHTIVHDQCLQQIRIIIKKKLHNKSQHKHPTLHQMNKKNKQFRSSSPHMYITHQIHNETHTKKEFMQKLENIITAPLVTNKEHRNTVNSDVYEDKDGDKKWPARETKRLELWELTAR